jgi:hypothetical protein
VTPDKKNLIKNYRLHRSIPAPGPVVAVGSGDAVLLTFPNINCPPTIWNPLEPWNKWELAHRSQSAGITIIHKREPVYVCDARDSLVETTRFSAGSMDGLASR